MLSTSESLVASLDANGLTLLGYFILDDGESIIEGEPIQPRAIGIVGNVGSALWPVFEMAREEKPALTLDRWSQETIDRIANEFGHRALYPFEGPPYWPFTRWAKRTRTLFPSPLGLTVHPVYGLWHAFRAALLFDEIPNLPTPALESPCTSCQGRPCLSSCPVGAFTADGYDFASCLGHLSTPANACSQGGCLARIACPVGQEHRYRQDHAAFHMTELLKAHGKL